MFDDDLRDAYLRHLGIEREPPSIDGLQRLLVAHLDRVPFETMWIASASVTTSMRWPRRSASSTNTAAATASC